MKPRTPLSRRRRAFEADVLGFRLRLLSSLFRTIQDTLKYLPRGLRYCLNPEDAVKMVGDMSMSTCWACGGAPPSWSFVCEECGGRGISSKSEHERMETLERDYWRGSMGQYSNPFRSRSPQLGFIAPAIPIRSRVSSKQFQVGTRALLFNEFVEAVGLLAVWFSWGEEGGRLSGTSEPEAASHGKEDVFGSRAIPVTCFH